MLIITARPKGGGVLPTVFERPFWSFAQIFGNDHPVEVEIGCGKGRFLLSRAARFPDVNFIGIDKASKWMSIGRERGAKREIPNLRFFLGDMRDLIRKIPPESVSLFHIYFPDPWPKRRHVERRLIRPDFLKAIHDRLAPGGLLEIATDHQDYFTVMLASAADTAALWSRKKTSEGERLFDSGNKTNYELKYETSGRRLFYMELVKS